MAGVIPPAAQGALPPPAAPVVPPAALPVAVPAAPVAPGLPRVGRAVGNILNPIHVVGAYYDCCMAQVNPAYIVAQFMNAFFTDAVHAQHLVSLEDTAFTPVDFPTRDCAEAEEVSFGVFFSELASGKTIRNNMARSLTTWYNGISKPAPAVPAGVTPPNADVTSTLRQLASFGTTESVKQLLTRYGLNHFTMRYGKVFFYLSYLSYSYASSFKALEQAVNACSVATDAQLRNHSTIFAELNGYKQWRQQPGYNVAYPEYLNVFANGTVPNNVSKKYPHLATCGWIYIQRSSGTMTLAQLQTRMNQYNYQVRDRALTFCDEVFPALAGTHNFGAATAINAAPALGPAVVPAVAAPVPVPVAAAPPVAAAIPPPAAPVVPPAKGAPAAPPAAKGPAAHGLGAMRGGGAGDDASDVDVPEDNGRGGEAENSKRGKRGRDDPPK